MCTIHAISYRRDDPNLRRLTHKTIHGISADIEALQFNKAVAKIYTSDEELEERKKAFEEILRIRKVSKRRIDYKALINYGRKD